jgi:hypothetical protein
MLEPTTQEQFALLYERLKFYHDGAIDAVFKVTAPLLVVIGWVTTSDSARSVLARDAAVRWCAVTAIVLFAVQFTASAWRTTERSRRIAIQLDSLGYLPCERYADIVLRRGVAMSFIVINWAFCVLAVVLILRTSSALASP